MYEAHFSPPQLGSLCDNISNTFSSSKGCKFYFHPSNILLVQTLNPHSEEKDFDFGTMYLENNQFPKEILTDSKI
jgi:hypothetical protein